MSNRDEDVLRFIVRYQTAYPGLSPTYRTIMDGVDIPSTSVVAYYIEKLTNLGKIDDAEHSNQHGLVLSDTALLTREDAEKMGIDWSKLTALRDQARHEMERLLDAYSSY